MRDLSIEYLRTLYWISYFKRPKSQGSDLFYVQVRDRKTGKVKGTRSTGETSKRKASEKMPQIVREIHQLIDDRPDILSWDQFCEKYTDEVLADQRDSTRRNMASIMRKIKTLINPDTVASIRPGKITTFKAKLRKEGLTPYSIKRNLSGLRRLLNWAKQIEQIDSVPYIPFPDSKDLVRQKGRSLATEELERMLSKVATVVGEDRKLEWSHFLRGLWLCGLRLDEACRLSWTEGDFRVDLSGITPRFVIQASGEKGKKSRRHPMTPDFFVFLMETSPENRVGPVFWPSNLARTGSYTSETAGKIISQIGEKAGVLAGNGRFGTAHYGSAQDFRRTFGERWRKIVQPEKLQQLMRHTDIKVTLTFYADGVDDDLAEDVWDHADDSQRQALRDYANNHANRRPSRF